MPIFSEVMAPCYMGVSLAHQGRLSEAISRMRTRLELLDVSSVRIGCPYIRSQLGAALAFAGDVDGALASINQALLPQDLGAGKPVLVQMPIGPVIVIFRKIRDLPNPGPGVAR